MTTTQLLASLPAAQREMARPLIEAQLPALQETARRLRPIMRRLQAVMTESTAAEAAA